MQKDKKHPPGALRKCIFKRHATAQLSFYKLCIVGRELNTLMLFLEVYQEGGGWEETAGGASELPSPPFCVGVFGRRLL